MGRIFKTLLLLVACISISNSQCPDLPNNTTVDGSNSTTIDMCGSMSALFEVNDPNLPTGSIDWYSSTTSGFDPLTTGTLIGQSMIDSADPCDAGGCPTIEVIYIDACGPGDESLNEFMVIGSGAGFAVDDLSGMFDMNNTFGGPGNGNINVGGVCGWSMGDIGLFSGCSSLISVGPGDYIPPNSAVIIQTSDANFMSTIYDISSMCGVSECIYVLSNSCDRGVGAFSNCGGGTGSGSTRTNEITLTCGCSDVLIYDILDPDFVDICTNIGNNGMHVFSDLTYANNTCNNGPILGSIPQFAYSAITDDFSHTFSDSECNTTQYVVGVLTSAQYNTDCCTEQFTEEYAFDIACVTAELQGNADLCPGECAEITVLITGGESPYDLNLSLTGLPFPFDNIMIPFVGFPVDEKITICFDNGGPLIDGANFTLDVPAIAAGFSGSLTLNTIVDNNGCAGTINGSSISVSFNDDPDIFDPGDLEACDMGTSTGEFYLSTLSSTINGGSGATVNYYSDMAGTMLITTDPYVSPGGPIYAQVMGTPCNSDIIEIMLIVIDNGDAGVIDFICTNPDGSTSNECTICDDDGVDGEEVNLTIFFDNPLLNYDFEVVWTSISGPSSTINDSGVGMATVTHLITETTTFVITVVTADGECPDMTDLGDVITINYSLAPDLEQPQNLTDCSSVTLPGIMGNDVPANAAYYSDPGGMGTMYNPGDIITSSMTLYLYAGIDGCEVDYSFEVTIDSAAVIDDPGDVVTCGVYVLPEVTGTNIDNVNYYTEMDGGGNIVTVGTIISNSVVLYLFDPNCGGNQPTLDITITPGPIIDNNTDTIVCEMYIVEPITGIDLSGNEMYFDTTDGNGLIINVGDTLTQDSILFIYDNTGGCEVQVPIFIDIQETGYPGLDTAIVLCQGDPTLININEELGGPLPDSTGTWLDINNTQVIIDSTQVDFSSLSSGIYLFEYEILDSICVDTHSVLTVNIIDIPDAGDNAVLTICSDTSGVDVYSLLGNPDIGGTFYDESNMVATFDALNASFDASTIGTTIYTYVVGNPGLSCGADSSTLTLVVEGSVSAGDDYTGGVCTGIIVDLPSLLNNNSGIGSFEEASVSGGLFGTTFDTEEVDDGTYVIYHILQGMGSCPPDTALLTINVMDGANAGDEMDIPLCGDTFVSLTDYVDGDPGGNFYFNNSLLPSGDIVFTNEVGSFDYLYIVGDGIECPFDTAVLTVIRNIQPASSLDISLENLCNEDCTTISFNAANTGTQMINIYYHIESNTGELEERVQDIGDLMPDVEVTFCIGIGDLSNNELQPGTEYTFTIDSISVDNPDCVYPDGSSVSFSTISSVMGTLTGFYCTGDTVTVGTDIYVAGEEDGTTIIPNGSVTGCDSIVEVDLEFGDFTQGIFMETACMGDTVFVNDTMYLSTNTTDEFIIPNGSENGCDSLVQINIVFFETTMGTYSEFLCSGETTIINGEEFYLGKEFAPQLLENANAMGCDSIVEVTITIVDPAFSSNTGDFCPSYSIEVDGKTYDQMNPSGIDTLENQAANGCDSIIMTNLTFNQQAIEITFDTTTCDDSYSITFGTETFDNSNLGGEVNLPSSSPEECDTILTVALTFGAFEVEYVEMDGGCEVTDSGLVVIESATGTAPYSITFNDNNTIAFSLPIELKIPVGMGEISIVDDDGCEAILPYELFSGGGENFTIDENQGQLSVSGGTIDSISWTPGDGLSCTDCISPILQTSVSTTYTATVFYNDSCTVELSIDVAVIDDTPDYILPSVFSPNGDNTNDNFVLTITKGAIGIPQSMLIYDRWGNRVYTGFGEDLIQNGWDGTKGGKDVAPGVYVYQVTLIENEKTVTLYGDLTVVR